MNYRIRMLIVLLVVSLFSGGSLSFMYAHLKRKIEENLRRELEESLRLLLPVQKYEVKEWKERRVYICYDSKGELAGFAIRGKGEGFQGKIDLLLAMDSHGERIIGIDILESQETPGLGAKIDEDWFKSQFRDKTVFPLKLVKMKKSPSPGTETTTGATITTAQIEAITGATISSRAVVNLVNSLVEDLKEFIAQR